MDVVARHRALGDRHRDVARARGRTDPAQITLYKSVGVAVQDAAAAAMVLDTARTAGVGRTVDL
jgi:ornithine cyclodeaminase/alanine dehydrogenase-like protein (mu-crystallin family)